jgi:hypothetical protein
MNPFQFVYAPVLSCIMVNPSKRNMARLRMTRRGLALFTHTFIGFRGWAGFGGSLDIICHPELRSVYWTWAQRERHIFSRARVQDSQFLKLGVCVRRQSAEFFVS